MVAPIFTIGGVDYTSYIDIQSVQLQGTATGGSLAFTTVLNSSQLNANPGMPRPGQIVSLTVDGTKEFEGVIMSSDQQVYASLDNYAFSCQCSDYTYLLGARLISLEMPAGSAGVLVRQLINNFAPGFGTRYVQDGYSVPKDQFDHVELSNALDKYAQAIGYSWYVDYDREVHFSPGDVLQGPLTSIALDTDMRFGDVSISEDISQLKNRIFVKDAVVKSSQTRTDYFTADGAAFFSLFSFPWTGDNIADDVKVWLNDDPVTVFEDPLTTQEGEIEGGESIVWVCPLNKGLRWPENYAPEPGDIVAAEYYPEEGGGGSGIVITLEDPDSIRMMKQRESSTGFASSGIHESVMSVPEMRVSTLDPLAYLGGIVLDRSAWPELRLSFTTSDPAVKGWASHQGVTVSSSYRNLYDAKQFWRQGARVDVFFHVQSTNKQFIPFNNGGTADILFTERVELSTVPARSSL